MSSALVWFRRDLRLHDHAALSLALQQHERVIPVFIFDPAWLSRLPAEDIRPGFIHACLFELKNQLQSLGSDLVTLTGDPCKAILSLAREWGATHVYANRDYDPDVLQQDQQVAHQLEQANIDWQSCKDLVIFEAGEVETQAGQAFRVFTPYWRRWHALLDARAWAEFPVSPFLQHLAPCHPSPLPTLSELGFTARNLCPAGETAALQQLQQFSDHITDYIQQRDIPAATQGVSGLSPYLRFGCISIRACVRLALQIGNAGAECWLKELCWRDFFQQWLYLRPDLREHAFQPQYDKLSFPNRQDWFTAWCQGLTGYPLIDAGMRQLLQTGWMHNRLRMLVASFLVKDLLIDWRWGERFFAQKLLDFDLASNLGGWQWAASVGCDAQPWFRLFNPVSQSQKHDEAGNFIRQYCPELAHLPDRYIHAPWQAPASVLEAANLRLGEDYPRPLVDHAQQREQTLALFRSISADQ